MKYADKRDPWEMKTPSGARIPIGTVTEIGDEEAESKAAHQAFEIGQKWMARIRKAITDDAHKRGH